MSAEWTGGDRMYPLKRIYFPSKQSLYKTCLFCDTVSSCILFISISFVILSWIPEVETRFWDKSFLFKKSLWNVFPFHSSQKVVFLLNLWFPWCFLTSKGTKNYVQGKFQCCVSVCLLFYFYFCDVFNRPWDTGGFDQLKLHRALHSSCINFKDHRLNSSCFLFP